MATFLISQLQLATANRYGITHNFFIIVIDNSESITGTGPMAVELIVTYKVPEYT